MPSSARCISLLHRNGSSVQSSSVPKRYHVHRCHVQRILKHLNSQKSNMFYFIWVLWKLSQKFWNLVFKCQNQRREESRSAFCLIKSLQNSSRLNFYLDRSLRLFFSIDQLRSVSLRWGWLSDWFCFSSLSDAQNMFSLSQSVSADWIFVSGPFLPLRRVLLQPWRVK